MRLVVREGTLWRSYSWTVRNNLIVTPLHLLCSRRGCVLIAMASNATPYGIHSANSLEVYHQSKHRDSWWCIYFFQLSLKILISKQSIVALTTTPYTPFFSLFLHGSSGHASLDVTFVAGI